MQLSERLCGSTKRVRAEKFLPQNLARLSDEDVVVIKEAYAPFICVADLDTEVERWKWKHRDGGILQLEDCVESTRHLYPNLHNIFTVLLTMPVTTSSAERSFSTLKWLKSYLRSTMASDRLSALALLHIHQDIAVDYDQVLQSFDGSGHRCIALAFDS